MSKSLSPRADLFCRLLRVFGGLTVCAVGEHFMIRANIGLAPWPCFAMGIANRTPLSYGFAMTVISLAVLLADFAMKERIGIAMLLDALYVGNATDFFLSVDPIPEEHSLVAGLLLMVLGMVIVVVGQYFYISAGLTCGPKDCLSVGLARRFPRIKVGTMIMIVLGTALLCGWLLGGSVGIGTVVTVFGFGGLTNAIFGLFHFEPRDVHQIDFIETAKILANKQ